MDEREASDTIFGNEEVISYRTKTGSKRVPKNACNYINVTLQRSCCFSINKMLIKSLGYLCKLDKCIF